MSNNIVLSLLFKNDNLLIAHSTLLLLIFIVFYIQNEETCRQTLQVDFVDYIQELGTYIAIEDWSKISAFM